MRLCACGWVWVSCVAGPGWMRVVREWILVCGSPWLGAYGVVFIDDPIGRVAKRVEASRSDFQGVDYDEIASSIIVTPL